MEHIISDMEYTMLKDKIKKLREKNKRLKKKIVNLEEESRFREWNEKLKAGDGGYWVSTCCGTDVYGVFGKCKRCCKKASVEFWDYYKLFPKNNKIWKKINKK